MNYCILGAAKSGVAVAQLANTIKNIAKNNSKIFVSELGNAENFSEAITVFDAIGVKYEFGNNSQTIEKAEKILPDFDCLIVSPGVPPTSNFIRKAQEIGIPVISELEFAFQNLKNPIIAITGTNGKTTTTSLITFMFNQAGKNAVSAGNIGLPLSILANEFLTNSFNEMQCHSEIVAELFSVDGADSVDENNNSRSSSTVSLQSSEKIFRKNFLNNSENKFDENTILVVEVSSYQLEFIDKFRPKVAIILNITPDHLNYHLTFENYKNAKLKIAKNQTSDDYLILNADDAVLNCKNINEFKNKNNIKSSIYHFALSQVERGIYLLGDKMINNLQQKKEEIMQTQEIKMPGVHNHYNSMAAAVAAKVWQLTNEDLRDSLMRFQGVEHRLEFVKTINGVDYINDSKATNVNASWYALSSYSKPIIWLAGGQGDNNDYSLLDKIIAKNVKKIISFGEESETIYSRYSQTVDCEKVETLYDAVRLAHSIANSGDVVLFTPACKSFDQFLNYEQRGEVFKQAVYGLVISVN